MFSVIFRRLVFVFVLPFAGAFVSPSLKKRPSWGFAHPPVHTRTSAPQTHSKEALAAYRDDSSFTVPANVGILNNNRHNKSPNPSCAGLVTNTGGSLDWTFGVSNPLDRVAMTARGNLQQIVSSFYDSPVAIQVERNQERVGAESNDEQSSTWDRLVHMSVLDGQHFCTATSTVQVHDENCKELLKSDAIGIGQLFQQQLKVIPSFRLLDAGYTNNTSNRSSSLWREYELSCDEVTCTIKEEFVSNLWSLQRQ